MKNAVLISTNGFEGTWPSIEYGTWVATVTGAPVVLLAVSEASPHTTQTGSPALDRILERATAHFGNAGVQFSIHRQQGRCEDVVPAAARQMAGIAVVGPLGRPLLTRLLVGRSIRGMLESIKNPVLYVPRTCLPLQRMLICVGGLGYDITAEHIALKLGAAAGAHVTLLHVALPVDLDYPTARLEREHWRDLEQTDSLLGRNIRAGLDAARRAGMGASLKARQGDVVEEIVAEAKAGAYDLVCMGSPHGFSGIRHLYEPRVTDEVAGRLACPLLTARYEGSPSD